MMNHTVSSVWTNISRWLRTYTDVDRNTTSPRVLQTSHRCEWSYGCVIWNNASLVSLQPLRVNILFGDVRWKTALLRRALMSGDGAQLAHVSGMGFYVEHMELLKYGIFLIWPLLFVGEENVNFFSITLLVRNGALLRFRYALKLQLRLLMELWGCGKTHYYLSRICYVARSADM